MRLFRLRLQRSRVQRHGLGQEYHGETGRRNVGTEVAGRAGGEEAPGKEDRGHTARGHLLRHHAGMADLMSARGRPLKAGVSYTIIVQMGTKDQLGAFCTFEGDECDTDTKTTTTVGVHPARGCTATVLQPG